MKYMINIGRFTFLDIIQGRVYQILLLATVFAPLFGALLSSLFMVDIGKVYMDGVMGVFHFVSIVFTLFIAGSLLARDIEQKVCYMFVVPPLSRASFLGGRFLGFIFAYIMMVMLIMVESTLIGYVVFSQTAAFYMAGYSWFNMSLLIALHACPYIAILGFVFFIVSWATGLAEIIFFSSMGLLLSWVLPSILLVIHNDTDSQTFLFTILSLIYGVLPHLNGAMISAALTHGNISLSFADICAYVIEHIAYAGVFFGLAIWFFNRRDL
ncbi:MAG: hypothetical protein Q9N02_00075 [Ghiorsea sp.]|nr:hypothetical protein [Ghiorsea sp.]